jgi:hypothetical protein
MEKLLLVTAIAIVSMAAAPAGNTPEAGTQMSSNQVQGSAPATTGEAVQAQAAPEEKKVCRLLPSSYSHHSDRVCLTKEQWVQVDKDLEQ